jgi:hypothetical protein
MKFNNMKFNNIKSNKGQGSTEMIILLSILLVIFLIFLSSNNDLLNSTEKELRSSKVRGAITTLVDGAKLVYSQGLGSSVIIRVPIPGDISSISFANQTITMTSTGTDTLYETLNFQVSGTIPNQEGIYFVTVESFNDTVLFYLADNSPPDSVTNLINTSNGVTSLYWTWTNPTNLDFSKSIVYLNGILKETTSNDFYNATGLISNKSYTITVHTKDTSGNINNTDVNHSAITIPPTGLELDYALLYTQICVAEDNSDKGDWDESCDGQYPNSCGSGDDLVTCNDGFQETHTALRSGKEYYYGGLKINSYNTAVNNCYNITKVEFCYEWWANSNNNLQDCDISVDANGEASYSAITTTCPGSSPPGVTCADVTSLETWICSNFFGSSGTRAVAKAEGQKSGGPGSATISWDVFYFNITYYKS